MEIRRMATNPRDATEFLSGKLLSEKNARNGTTESREPLTTLTALKQIFVRENPKSDSKDM